MLNTRFLSAASGAAGALLIMFGFAHLSFANITYLSSDPAYAEGPFTFYCSPYSDAFEANNTYDTVDGPCVYSVPQSLESTSNKIIALYKGTVGGSEFVIGDEADAGPTLVRQDFVVFPGTAADQDYFGVIYESALGLDSYLTSGGDLPEGAVENESFYVLPWKRQGLGDVGAPSITIHVPEEGATYYLTDTIVASTTITDPEGSPISEVVYAFADTGNFDGPTLPFEGREPGPIELLVFAADVFGNVGQASVTFTLAEPPPNPICADGIDNDEDGLTDYPSDPGCESAEDNDETDIIAEPPLGAVVCAWSLSGTAKAATKVGGSARIEGTNCETHTNSTNVSAIDIAGSSKIISDKNCVVGGVKKSGSASITPNKEECDAKADPFASLATPVVGSCTHNNHAVNGSGNKVLNPGVYCGGLNIGGSAKVTMNPGLYIIKDGKLTINGSAKVDGNGVSIFLTGNNTGFNLGGSSKTNLVATESGPLAGFTILLDGASDAADASDINGSVDLTMHGVMYLPNQKLRLSGSAEIIGTTFGAVLADMFDLSGSSKMRLNGNRDNALVPIPAGL